MAPRLTAMRGKRTKKKISLGRRDTNSELKMWGGVPLFSDNMTDEQFDYEWRRSLNMFSHLGTSQEKVKAVKNYIKSNRKKDVRKLALIPDTLLACGLGTYLRVWEFALRFPEGGQEWVDTKIDKLLSDVKPVKKTTKKVGAPVITPMQRLKNKVYNVVISELDALEEEWMNNNKAEIDVFTICKSNGIKGSGVGPILDWAQPRLEEMQALKTKKDKELNEAFSHVKPRMITHQIKVLTSIVDDCEKIKAATKAQRTIRTPKSKSADKQVAKLNFLKESNQYKVSSVNPLTIVGAKRLIIFNAKTRKLEEYQTDRPDGFEVKGQSLQHVNRARGKLLRKPDEFIKIALKKTVRQFDKEFNNLTTKEYNPNGRFNKDAIILLAK